MDMQGSETRPITYPAGLGPDFRGRELAQTSSAEIAEQLFNVPARHLRVFGHQLFHPAYRVEHRGVIAPAERPPDVRLGQWSEALRQVYGDVTRPAEPTRPTRGNKFVNRYAIFLRNHSTYVLGISLPSCFSQFVIIEHFSNDVCRHSSLQQLGICNHPSKCAFEFTNTATKPVGQLLDHGIIDRDVEFTDPGMKKLEPELEIRRTDLRAQSGTEPRLEGFALAGQLVWATVRGDDDPGVPMTILEFRPDRTSKV